MVQDAPSEIYSMNIFSGKESHPVTEHLQKIRLQDVGYLCFKIMKFILGGKIIIF